MEDDNVNKKCVREWWETPKTTPRKLRTLEIVLKDVESSQNWLFFWVFPIVFVEHWHILDFSFDAPTLFLFFWFLDQIFTILSMTVNNKRHQDSCWEVRHHVVGDYNFLTQKKIKILKIISSPPAPLLFHVVNPTMHIWICAIYIW
jgi:hypothetical protein